MTNEVRMTKANRDSSDKSAGAVFSSNSSFGVLASFVIRHSSFVISLGLALLTAACYWPMTRHQFIYIDDQDYITENSHVTSGLTWAGFLWAFRSGYSCNWHPLTWLTHMLDCQLYGLNAGGHHLTNLLLHSANTVLVFIVLKLLTARLWPSAFVAALFGLHPIHVESVAWASERKDVLSTLFFLLALLAYTSYARGKGNSGVNAEGECAEAEHQKSKFKFQRSFLLSLTFYFLGLLSKPMVVTFPFVLLLLDYWPLRRLQWSARAADTLGAPASSPASLSLNQDLADEDLGAPRTATRRSIWSQLAGLVYEKLPFFVLTVAVSIVTYFVQKSGGATVSFHSIPIGFRIGNASLAYVGYISKTLVPVRLALMYPYPNHLPIGGAVGSLAFLLLVTLLLLKCVNRLPFLLVGWLWFLGTLVPVIGLIQVGAASMADRYMYIPSIGFFMLLAWGLESLLNDWPWRRLALSGAGGLALLGCLVLTSGQLGHWSNNISLARHALDAMPENYLAYDGYGRALESIGKKDEALQYYFASVKMAPTFPQGRYNLGTLLLNNGRIEEAVVHLSAAVSEDPKFEVAQNNLGSALFKLGRVEEAKAQFVKAITLNPEDARAHFNLGTAWLAQSHPTEALAEFSAALKLKSEYPEALGSLGATLAQQGRAGEAIAPFTEAARLTPNDPQARFNLGLALSDAGKPVEAAVQFEELLKLNQDNAAAHYRLAVALVRQHKSRQAVAHYREAVRLRPDFPDVLNELAWILSTDPDPSLRDGPEAVKFAEEACRQTQNQQAAMLGTLGAAYAEAGKFDDAIAACQKARNLASSQNQTNFATKLDGWLKLLEQGQKIRD